MMADLINLLVGNLGVTLEYLVLFLTILGSLILFAKDLRLGSLILFLLFVAEYIIFSLLGMETFATLTAILTTVVILSLSLYITHSKSAAGLV